MEKVNCEGFLQLLEKSISKEKTVSSLANQFDMTEFEILGYIKELKDKGVNISYYEKDQEAYVVINDHPDFAKENIYSIKTSLDNNTKIAVISDLHFGSKYEQIAILNDMYRKFALDEIKYVLVVGNLIEGVYSNKDALEFGSSLITNDPQAQADHLIEYYPRVDGITTLFVTGKTDHSCSKKLNVGDYISKNRSDMIYLGPKSCTLKFNNVSIKAEQVKNGDAYTVAYPPQKYSRSMSSYEDYDIVLLGGTRNAQYFPYIRDMQLFSIPSVVGRTPKMVSLGQQNSIGALTLDIEYSRTGGLKRLVPEFVPYYEPSKENYLTTKKLDIKKDEAGNLIFQDKRVVNTHAHFEMVDKFYKRMKKEQSFTSLMDKFDLSDMELTGLIDVMKQYGRPVDIVDVNGELVVRKTYQQRRHYDVKPAKEELIKREFGVISDTHYGSIWSQPSMVNTFCYEAYNRGIEDMFHIGDISDGDYHTIRPNYINEVFLYGATAHIDYTAKTLPKYPGMKWHIICGSHDQSHSFNYGAVDFGKDLAAKRPDIEYLGQDRAIYMMDNCKIELFHPGGGTSRILSTKPQNGIDQMPSGNKPNLSLRGHYHKTYYMLYRNIHTLLCPCNVDQSSFMMKNELPNLMGDYFVSIYYDENGDIHYMDLEPMIFSQEDVRERDYEKPTKYMKHKILTKHIK